MNGGAYSHAGNEDVSIPRLGVWELLEPEDACAEYFQVLLA